MDLMIYKLVFSWRRTLLGTLATVAAALAMGVGSASAADVTNGSFEAGHLSGWWATDPSDSSCTASTWTVLASPSDGWCFTGWDRRWPQTISAVDGKYFADVTWDGDGRSAAMLRSHAVSVPADTPLTLSWSDNTSWDLTFGATQPRVEYVDILDRNGSAVLQSYTIKTLRPRTIGATGWVWRTLHLSSVPGTSMQIRFRLTVPEAFTGLANFALDNVTLVAR
jgi:hypothetical protein